jgi:hypothetical protein
LYEIVGTVQKLIKVDDAVYYRLVGGIWGGGEHFIAKCVDGDEIYKMDGMRKGHDGVSEALADHEGNNDSQYLAGRIGGRNGKSVCDLFYLQLPDNEERAFVEFKRARVDDNNEEDDDVEKEEESEEIMKEVDEEDD